MIIDFSTTIKNLDGKEIEVKDKGVVTLASISCDALLFAEEKEAGEEKYKKFKLAEKIYSNPESVNLAIEEAALIKKIIPNFYGPLVVGRVWEILENK